MTYLSGGVGDFVNESIECYPSTIWTTFFGWHPSNEDPLVWIDRKGAQVARFERLHGPIRKLAGDRFHRQPIMQRWVVNRSSLDETISDKENLKFETHSDIKVESLRI